MTTFAESFVNGQRKKKDDTPDIICVDGKAMRGKLQDKGRNPDIVSAYFRRRGITLAAEACDEKSNEIRAIPRLIDDLTLPARW